MKPRAVIGPVDHDPTGLFARRDELSDAIRQAWADLDAETARRCRAIGALEQERALVDEMIAAQITADMALNRQRRAAKRRAA